jgi:ferredoxin
MVCNRTFYICANKSGIFGVFLLLKGACEGTLSCSTCHLILEKANYEQLKEPTDEENDMLDLAYGLTETYVK